MLNAKDYNALDLAQPTNFRGMLKSGRLLWGTSCRMPAEDVARVLAALPYNFCFIDAEHTPIGAAEVSRLIKTIQYFSHGSMVPIVRTPGFAPDLVAYCLNSGAGGIIQPHVRTAEEARRLVRVARFPPCGDRSFPPGAYVGGQARAPAGRSIYEVCNEHIAVICQIEDVEGVQNIDEIAAVPGVDALMVGATDLRFSLGLEAGTNDGDEGSFLESMEKISKAANANNLPILGFATSPEELHRRLASGWSAFMVHGDSAGLYSSGLESLEKYRSAAEGKSVNAIANY
ncbi:hypothetical protein VTL71DRAFT_3527 [Oculimacula yallundae]|uniref:HpcH/HpaI aldolase/citrate lyase domain-containing protein n=1 Tax=Oculimacula yallundae TaxID=86028 RepID=A0ABR4C7F2_9HELO